MKNNILIFIIIRFIIFSYVYGMVTWDVNVKLLFLIFGFRHIVFRLLRH